MPETSTQEPSCTAHWWNDKHPPAYEFHFQGQRSVNILIALRDGSVWPGDYTEGKWCVLGVEVPKDKIGAWCRYPKAPDLGE